MIVEYLEEQDFAVSWVLEVKSHRLTILSAKGTEAGISVNRVLISMEAPKIEDKKERQNFLEALALKRKDLSETIDLKELWSVLEGEGTQFTYQELAELFYGESSANQVSAIIRAIFLDGILFQFTPKGAIRRTSDEVEERRRQKEEEINKEEIITETANCLQRLVKDDLSDLPANIADIIFKLKDYALKSEEAHSYQELKIIFAKANLKLDFQIVFDLLVNLSVFSKHENLDLLIHEIPQTFSKDVFLKLDKIDLNTFLEDENRLDLSSENAFTIDTPGAKDLDDALTFKQLSADTFQLGIHITDLGALISKDSLLGKIALNRISSIYMPDLKIPMLPSKISDELFSLKLNELRPVYSLMVTLDKDANILDYNFQSAKIKVKEQMTFSEADNKLGQGGDLALLSALSQKMLENREKQGAIVISIPKQEINLDPNGKINLFLIDWEAPSRLMLGEIMILANHLAAKTLQEAGWPCPYRSQAAPQDILFKNPEDKKNLALLLAQRRLTGRSNMSLHPEPHHGLGHSVYTGFTAPVRRYLDLVVSQQLQALQKGGAPLYDEQEMLTVTTMVEEGQRLLGRLQNRRNRYWLLIYLETKIDKVFKTLVFAKLPRRRRVCILDFMLEIDIFDNQNNGVKLPEVGEMAYLKLTRAEARSNTLRFVWVDK